MTGAATRAGPPFTFLVTAVAVGLLLFLIAWLAPVLGPLGLGLFIAALAAPLFGRLEASGLSPVLSLTVTVALVLAIGGAIVLLAVVSARSLSDSIASYATELETRSADAASWRAIIPPDVLTQVLRDVIAIVGQVATASGFAVVVAALLLLDGRRLSGLTASGLGSADPVFSEAPALARAAVTYFVVRIRVNAVTAVGLLLLMLVLGVDDPLLWAIGAFFLSFVPYLGLVIALIPPTILALAESGPGAALAIVIGGTILNLIAENVLEPTLTGRALELSTWLVFIMFFLWVWILGPIGALLSMPITVLVVLVLRHNERTSWLASILSRSAVSHGDVT